MCFLLFSSKRTGLLRAWGSTGSPRCLWRRPAIGLEGRGPGGSRGWGLQNLGLLESVTLRSTAPKASGSEHGPVAGLVAIGLAFVLSVSPRPEVSVFPHFSHFRQGHASPSPGDHPLSQVHLLVTLGALGHGGAGSGAGGWAGAHRSAGLGK